MPARLLTACLAAVPALGAQEPDSPRERLLAHAIAGLADPVRSVAAAESLVRMGPAAVAPLAQLVAIPQRHVEPRSRVLAALYVLGRLGADALPALATIHNATRDRDGAIATQAMWVLGEVGLHAAEEVRADIARQWVPSGSHAQQVTCVRLRLGAAPDPEQFAACLASARAGEVVAACRLLAAPVGRSMLGGDARERWLGMVHRQLEVALAPAGLPWEETRLRAAAADLAAAQLALGGADDLLAGRGLLRHYEPLHRRRGLALVAGARDEPRAVRAELLPLLFDQEAEVRQLAARTFGRWGARGLLALPALRRLSSRDEDVAVRAACASVAGDLVRSVAEGPGREALLALDARLQGRVPGPPPVPADPAALQVVVEMLCGGEWCDADAVERLLVRPARGVPVPAGLATAVLRYCANRDPALRAVAAAWLCRHGHAAHITGFEEVVRQANWVSGSRDAVLFEALAWLRAGPEAGDEQVREAFGHANARVVLRALAEWVARGAGTGPGDAAALQDLLSEEPSDAWGGSRWRVLAADLGPEVRTAAKLAQFAAGLLRPPHEPPWEATFPDEGSAAWMRERYAARDWGTLLGFLEQRARRRLAVPDGVAPH